MNIILVGAGRIGSAVAFCLARGGHDVTVVARGTRLDALQRDGGVTTVDGQHQAVTVVAVAPPDVPYDLLIVAVPEHQIDALVPGLRSVSATTVLFMFNTFLGTAPYRAIVGSDRFAFGFPNMVAYFEDQRLRFRVDGPGMVTTLSHHGLARLFRQAGMPTEVEDDMDGFLRSHVAMVVPLFVGALLTWQRKEALTWAEARRLDVALTEGCRLVRELGHSLKPPMLARLLRIPSLARTAVIYLLCRLRAVKDVGAFGPAETRALIDSMAAVGQGRVPHVVALRP